MTDTLKTVQALVEKLESFASHGRASGWGAALADGYALIAQMQREAVQPPAPDERKVRRDALQTAWDELDRIYAKTEMGDPLRKGLARAAQAVAALRGAKGGAAPQPNPEPKPVVAFACTDFDGHVGVGLTRKAAKEAAGEHCHAFIPLYSRTTFPKPNSEPRPPMCRIAGVNEGVLRRAALRWHAQQDGLQGAAPVLGWLVRKDCDEFFRPSAEASARSYAAEIQAELIPLVAAAPAYEPLSDESLRVDLPARVVEAVAQQIGMAGPFTQDFHDFAQALMHEVCARVPSAVLARIGARVEMETANHVHSTSGDLRSSYGSWRPIDTAPKDGALVILGASKGVWIGKHVPVYQSGFMPSNPWSSMLLNHDHMAERYTRPTHWMPLPPPPKEKP